MIGGIISKRKGAGLIFFVAVSNIIYYYMVKELGKKLKWGGENE